MQNKLMMAAEIKKRRSGKSKQNHFKKHRPTIQTDAQTMKRIVSVYGIVADMPQSKLERRSNIIEEIIQTETGFVYDMETLRDLFCTPMREQFPIIFHRGCFNLLYDTLEEMLVHQTKFLKVLQQTGIVSNTVTGQSAYVGRTLKEYAPAMKFMADYTMYYETASKSVAQALEDNEDFVAFLEATRARGRCRVDLLSYLIMPCQRNMRYPMLIEELLKHTR